MITYTFRETYEDGKKTPLYEQLYEFIKGDILSGKLKADSPLPSKRTLSKNLHISVMTIENSYSQLMSEGYIYSMPRKGFFVSDIFSHGNIQITSSVNDAEKNQFSEILTKSKDIYADFTSNATEPESFPFSIWAKITRRILSESQELLMENSPSNGLLELRRSIAAYLRDFRGISVNPENIIISSGTETMYNLLIQLLGHELVYGSEDPGYKKIALTLDANSVKNVLIPLDKDGIMPSHLEKKQVNIIHTSPSHHFPTGITMPVKRRYELLNWANQSDDRYIIEDDYDSEFRMSGLPIPSLYSMDQNEKVIYMNTFTKSLSSNIRISYMVLPQKLMNDYNRRLSFYSCTVPTFEQLTLAEFMSNGHYEKHINRMRNVYRKKRDLLLKEISNCRLGDRAEISEETSGLHFILKLRLEMTEKEFIKRCKDSGILIHPLSENSESRRNSESKKRVKSDSKNQEETIQKNATAKGSDIYSFLINYSSVPSDRIDEAIRRICLCATSK